MTEYSSEFPHEFVFGTTLVIMQKRGDYKEHEFYAMWERAGEGWLAFRTNANGDKIGDIKAFGYTPKESFDSVLRQVIIHPTTQEELLSVIYRCYPIWLQYFDEEGEVYPTPISGQGLTKEVINELSDYPYD